MAVLTTLKGCGITYFVHIIPELVPEKVDEAAEENMAQEPADWGELVVLCCEGRKELLTRMICREL